MSNDTPQLRAFKVKFLGPTNHRGARITITEPSATRFEGIRSRRTFSYDYATGNVLNQGIETLVRMGFNVQGYTQTETSDAYTIVCDNWGEEWLDLNGDEAYQAEGK
tara:strand:+ start:603 stop:923 length:321 start_codon:yes stop_codon:yes gene_type:complete